MTTDAKCLAHAIRVHSLRMVHAAHGSHLGGCLSAADIVAVLYSSILRVRSHEPDWPERDRFVMSKGHAAAVLYAVLAECGFFPPSLLTSYCSEGSLLLGHVSAAVPGVEASTGSLGHGLSVACGMALALHRRRSRGRVMVLAGDGDLQEGSTWEAVMFASAHALDALTLIIDANGMQAMGRVEEILTLEPLAQRFEAFGWAAATVDGHDYDALSDVLSRVPLHIGKPTAVIARTVKGKGVSFMQGKLSWHYQTPTDDELKAALAELGAQR